MTTTEAKRRRHLVAARSRTAKNPPKARGPRPTYTIVDEAQPERAAATHLNYRGNVSIAPHRPMGPNLLGEQLWPVTATYDPDTDRTRVGLSYIAPAVR